MQVMFVDDESRVLSGIERALMMQDTGWFYRFATSGQDALAMLEEHPADVVVSDMRMPFMDGAELLAQVRERWPRAIRIILSGYSDAEATLRMLDVAHRFVAKPCDSKTLLATVENALALRNMFLDPKVAEIVGRINYLPPAPKLFLEISRHINNPGADTRKIIDLLSSDPALTARIMQLANSAWFSRGNQVSDIGKAITNLGLEQVKLLVLASHVFTEAKTDPYVEQLQQKAMLASGLATRIAGKQGPEQTASLLANTGLLIPELRTPEYVKETTACNTPLSAAISAYLLTLWGLPAEITDAVAHHQHPARLENETFGITGVVHVAVMLANDCSPDLSYLEQTGMLNKLPQWQAMLTELQETTND
ncbi:response regulator [Mangrovibacter phragmitis]|uniref:Response regulator n=1 Tax=Mangrovibacter phragmitis TaxID=1691903 RepID=A0A1B7L6N2_9ENTR|nr:HDOD domain-containing protein [Mangrovibacter phragmitis]OAT77940.1 response regulator [Mangrovibacter phragmitis]